MRPAGDRYKWVVLIANALGAGAFSMLRMGLPALGPALRDERSLSLSRSLTQVGLVFSAVAAGVCVTLLPWGMLTDRVGERPVMAGAQAAFAVVIGATAFSTSYTALLAPLQLDEARRARERAIRLGLLFTGPSTSTATGAAE